METSKDASSNPHLSSSAVPVMTNSDEQVLQTRQNALGNSPQREEDVRPGPSHLGLTRLYSGNFLDDQTHYHDQDERNLGNKNTIDPNPELKVEERDLNTEAELEVGAGVKDQEDLDLEAGSRPEKSTLSRSNKDPNIVDWEGGNDPENPKNWTLKRKWAATFIVSAFTFISPVSSSMVAPALTSIARDFQITSEVESAMTLSIFVLAYSVGPLFIGPLSELYGRVIVLQLANLIYLFFNLGCGFAQSKGQMIAFRFLSGLGGSAPLAIGGGVLGDLFMAEQRGKAISIYSLAPLLGPAVGPIAGGFITEHATWRWIFYSMTIFDGVVQLVGFFYLQETYAPVLLHRKKLQLIKTTGNLALHTEYDRPDRTLLDTIRVSLTRPFILLGTQIIIQVLALYMAFLFGIIYLVLSTFPALWENEYHQSIGIGGLNYISLGVGFFLGSQIAAPFQDKIYKALKNRNKGVGRPEFRVPLMIPGALLVPIGLFIYGWSAQYHTHWVVPNIGAVFFAAGTIIGFQCIQTYIVDTYTLYAASAIAAVTCLRSLAGFGFPLFAPAMYQALKYGWGNSLLGFVSIALGWPAPLVLWKLGERMRRKSPFAAR